MNEAAALFGESASRIVVSTASQSTAGVLERAAAAGVAARVIGRTGGSRLRVAIDGRIAIDLAIDDIERVWSDAIGRYFVTHAA
jgi:phosphoribosylformylglycinamidine synthase